jgi:hypothetical protein
MQNSTQRNKTGSGNSESSWKDTGYPWEPINLGWVFWRTQIAFVYVLDDQFEILLC